MPIIKVCVTIMCVWLAAYLGTALAIKQAFDHFHNNYAVIILQHADGDFVAKDTDNERALAKKKRGEPK